MEHWHSTGIPSISQQSERYALTTTSGNTPSYAVGTTDGVENQAPLPQLHSLYGLSKQKHVDGCMFNDGTTLGTAGSESAARQDLIYPPPGRTLGSNDRHHDAIRRLDARRRRRDARFDGRDRGLGRGYLSHPEYLKYRSRPRRDIGKDGRPVWDDRLEEAFQNALINIEPMGKKKRSQNNKPYGRNELIAEWIYHETGVKRCRKQVSSHIQVLNHLLKNVPSWIALTKDLGLPKSDDAPKVSGYYAQSIRDTVQQIREHKNSHSNALPHALTLPLTATGLNAGTEPQHHLSGLSFHMWVSPPDRLESALHNYTRSQSSRTSSAPTPIEDVRNWRRLFPKARAVIEENATQYQCDIVLLESSFQLMSDFPPSRSKLGIVLELDFTSPGANFNALADLNQWCYMTSMYQDGQLVNQVRSEHCDGSSPGKLRLDFEALWWAFTFTDLTEKRRRAEDSKNEETIKAANEASYNFFRGLTVVQEVYSDSTSEALDQPFRRGRRVALLLWRFSQAQSGYVGTTTWRKLIPPPDRRTTNSPSQRGHEMGLPLLPPLVMDTMIEGIDDAYFHGNGHEFLVEDNIMHMDTVYDTSSQQLTGQNSFPSCTEEDFTSFTTLHGSDLGVTDPQLRQTILHPDLSLSEYNHTPPSSTGQMQHSLLTAPSGRAGRMNDYFDAEIHRALSQPALPAHYSESFTLEGNGSFSQHACSQLEFGGVSPATLYDDDVGSLPRRPLTSFDVSTHQNLQAQLNQSTDYARTNISMKDTPLQALARRHQLEKQLAKSDSVLVSPERYLSHQYWLDLTSMHDTSEATNVRATKSDYNKGSEHKLEPEYLAPVPTRPALQSHASYLSRQEARQLDQEEAHDDSNHHEQAESTHDVDMSVNLEAFEANNLAAVLSAHNAELDRQAASFTEDSEVVLAEHTVNDTKKLIEINEEDDLVVIDLREVGFSG